MPITETGYFIDDEVLEKPMTREETILYMNYIFSETKDTETFAEYIKRQQAKSNEISRR